MKWFRLYNEIIDDPKISELSDKEFRHWIYLMCLSSEREKEGLLDLCIEKICWRLRIMQQELEETIGTLKGLRIIEEKKNGIEFINWKKRQYRSDTSTERVKKHRQKQGTLQKRYRNGERNGPETETETETEYKDLTSLESQKDGVPHEEILKLYHTILPELARVRAFTQKRKSMLGARWQESKKRQKLDWWSGYFEYVSESKFLMGEKGDFQANFEWLINASSLIKVLEGNYHR